MCVLAAACSDDPVSPPAPPAPPATVPIGDLLTDSIAIAVNPNERVPLAARATFSTVEPVIASVRVLGAEPVGHEVPGPTDTFGFPILGLHPDVENLVEVMLTKGDGSFAADTLSITTAALPDFFPAVVVTAADTALMEPGWTLSSLSIGDNGEFRTIPIMFDRMGQVRWYLDLSDGEDMGFAIERLANGNLLIGQGRAIFEYDMLGEQVNRWEMQGFWYHHDVIEQANGNLLVAVIDLSSSTIEDYLIELDRITGAVLNEWDLGLVLDMFRRSWGGTDTDWFHMNAIWVDPDDQGIILSGQRQGVVKIDRSGDLVWILAPHRGWGLAGPDADGLDTREFLLTAVDADGVPYPAEVQDGGEAADDFDWAWGQHAPLVLPNGNLFLFDNGLNRRFIPDPMFSSGFSRGVEYAIDEENMTVRQVWSWGEDRGIDYYAPIISDVDFLPTTGHRLIMPGIVFGPEPKAFVTEVTESGEVVFEAEVRFRNDLSTGEPAWGQFDLVYRSERMTLYPQ